jgi:hypothetical protein
LLVIVGFLIALDVLYDFAIISKLWPVFVIFLGAGFLGIFFKRGKREPAYLGIGIYLLAFSLLAFYCNFTSWALLARLWPLFILILGLVFIMLFFLSERRYINILFGLILVSLSAVFLLVFSLGGQYWWSVFILTGLSILIAERFHAK